MKKFNLTEEAFGRNILRSIFQCLFVEKPWKWENLQRPACVSGGGETTRRGDAGSHGPCQCEKS